MHYQPLIKPLQRSRLRYEAARVYHSARRYLLWRTLHKQFAREISTFMLPYTHIRHETILLRQLKEIDMILQYNKITNLRIAVKKLNGIVVHPGQTLSYWKLIGKPTYKKGYVDGVTLRCGKAIPGCGGGLCQLSNLIYWMTLHTPLTVTERHRHGYDVFPDASRTQPFGSGATCFYPYGDLMIKNTTNQDFQLCIRVGEENLEGQWRSAKPAEHHYEIIEKNHYFNGEFWGGFSRHNELYRRIYDIEGNYIDEEFVTENHALTMYSPLIADISGFRS